MSIVKNAKLLLSICLLNFIASAIAYFYLPDTIVTNFGLTDSTMKYGHKWIIFIDGIAALTVFFFLMLLFALGNKSSKKPLALNGTTAVTWGACLLLIIVNALTIIAGFKVTADYRTIILSATCIFVFALSNYFGKVSRNRVYGIRTKWTLADDRVWDRTHNFAKYSVSFGSLFALTSVFLLQGGWKYLSIVIVIISLLIPVSYSYFFYKNLHN